MNIVICAGAFGAVSGYNLVVRRFAAEFKARGHRAVILCRKSPAVLSPGESAEDFYAFPAMSLVRGRRAFSALDRFRPDVVFTHNFDLTDLLGFRYGRKRNVPVFSMCHVRFGPYIRLSIPWKPLRLRFIARMFERWVAGWLKKSTLVFALTEDMKTYLREMGLERLAVVSCGVDPELLGPAPDGPRKTPAAGDVRLLFVGQIREMKNQIFLLETSRFLPDGFRLDLVGGKSWDHRYYRKFVRTLRSGRYPKVEWHGEIGRAETAEFFRNADIFLNPSLIEVQNLSQIEAFIAGLPTVRLHGPLTQGVTVHLRTAVHLDEKTSPKDFAEAVVRLVRDQRLCDEIRANALAEGSKYSWRTAAERVLDFFSERARG